MMNKLKRFSVSNITYRNYIKTHENNRLHRFAEIETSKINNSYSKELRIDEMFDYRTLSIPKPELYKTNNIDNEYNYEYTFKTKFGNEYRVDLVKYQEKDIDTKLKKKLTIKENKNNKGTNPLFYYEYIHDQRLLDNIVVSISFSIKNANVENYDTKTERYESMEILNHVLAIVDNFSNKFPNYIYMFGDPEDDKKMSVYKYMIKECFPDYELISDYTTQFSKTNNGYYLFKKIDNNE